MTVNETEIIYAAATVFIKEGYLTPTVALLARLSIIKNTGQTRLKQLSNPKRHHTLLAHLQTL